MKKAFTLIELLIVIAIIGILSTVIIVSLNSAKNRAKEAKYITYVSQVSGMVKKAINLGAFDSVPTVYPDRAGCLGIYKPERNCWGGSANYENQSVPIDTALNSVGTLPAGEYGPYSEDFGTAVINYPTYVRVLVYVGAGHQEICDKFGWGEWPGVNGTCFEGDYCVNEATTYCWVQYRR